MQKKIILVAGSTNTKQVLYQQIRDFIPSNIDIEAYASEEGIAPSLKCDMLIISSARMKDELKAMNIEYDCKDIIVCERSINVDYIDQVAGIPLNEEVLLVNDEKETTESSINDLVELGLNHIKYYPYYPGIENYKKLKIAITPGEPDKVPSCARKIVDIGPRIIDINTLYIIMDKLNLNNRDTRIFTKRYIEKIINVSKHVSAINNNVSTLNGYLNNIVDSLVNGILVFDENGYIKYANEEMIKIFSLENKTIENKNIKNMVDREMLSYFLSGDVYENKPLNIFGYSLKLSKFKIPNSNNIVVTTNRDGEENIKRKFSQDLLLKGHLAKYNFEDIIGNSQLIRDIKDIALKLSKSELTVLIEGESGTGKELFASAIHNNSKRKYGPFLAVNFSALPDELIESELFGYEEGAFTGAKKGGKIGLFELADGGTIFLDEIGDVSPKVQTKLLRVLQEKEIMPLGGTTIKGVDVRIIAATNKNLKKMVLAKEFRSDLYYRLKIGYINLPPLRTRLTDIEDLVYYFIKNETSADIVISQDVLEEFKKYKWLGNIRELESTIKYMLAVRTSHRLTLSDLPDRKFFEEEIDGDYFEEQEDTRFNLLNDEMTLILECIEKLHVNNMVAGREKIAKELRERGYNLTDNQIRARLESLHEKGYINKRNGKYGAILSSLGIEYLRRSFK